MLLRDVSSMYLRAKDHLRTPGGGLPEVLRPTARPVRQHSGPAATEEWEGDAYPATHGGAGDPRCKRSSARVRATAASKKARGRGVAGCGRWLLSKARSALSGYGSPAGLRPLLLVDTSSILKLQERAEGALLLLPILLENLCGWRCVADLGNFRNVRFNLPAQVSRRQWHEANVMDRVSAPSTSARSPEIGLVGQESRGHEGQSAPSQPTQCESIVLNRISACPADMNLDAREKNIDNTLNPARPEFGGRARSSSFSPPVFSAPRQEVLGKSRCALWLCLVLASLSFLHEVKLSFLAAEARGVDVLVFRPVSDRQKNWRSCWVSAP